MRQAEERRVRAAHSEPAAVGSVVSPGLAVCRASEALAAEGLRGAAGAPAGRVEELAREERPDRGGLSPAVEVRPAPEPPPELAAVALPAREVRLAREARRLPVALAIREVRAAEPPETADWPPPPR